jgi:hypothetical protein
MDQHVTAAGDKHLAPDHVPLEWPPVVASPHTLCACPSPVPRVRAEWKGAARTYCTRCGLPMRIEFRPR